MARTPEQVAADDALTEAIKVVMDAYKTSKGGLLTGYLVFTVHQGFEEDGGSNARYDWIVMDDGMPWDRILGLHRIGGRMLEADMESAFQAEEED